MTYINTAVIIIATLAAHIMKCQDYNNLHNNNYIIKEFTREIRVKQGQLKGVVVHSRTNRDLPPVEIYLGIPYAAPPVGQMRYMPSNSAPTWTNTKICDSFGPVCPQKFPDLGEMSPRRRDQFLRLKKFLADQSEDCLYLNIYAPYQEGATGKYPVIVFIHGESFEWNSGNPYDGSVLAGYGNVIVVTFNFRLGILGFLDVGNAQQYRSNFGLADQIAALLWVKNNIAAFGGDPDMVTLLGHDTGAVSANLLMLSPLSEEGNKMLFRRAILMGGTALSDWALAGSSRGVTYQVAQAINCPSNEKFAECLRKKRHQDLLDAVVNAPPYRTKFGPVVDAIVIPNDPVKSMTTYSDLFRRFELMYGVTEMESVNLVNPTFLERGMLEEVRDNELNSYLRSRCEMMPRTCVDRLYSSALAEYTQSPTLSTEKYGGYTGEEPDRASIARDTLLDILSDARTVAPVVQTGKYHALLNAQSYFYVFTHKTASRDYIRNKSFNGEDLPYVFGVPLDGPKFHFTDTYTESERLLSEKIMTYFCNFATSGNPNVPRKQEYYSLSPKDWLQNEVDWPEFEAKQERYLQLDIPLRVQTHYRSKEMKFWNEQFPQLLNSTSINLLQTHFSKPNLKPSTFKSAPPYILYNAARSSNPAQPNGFNKFDNFYKPLHTNEAVYGEVKLNGDAPDNFTNKIEYGKVLTSAPDLQKGTATNILIIVGAIFLLGNLLLFAGLYYKCYVIKKKSISVKNEEQTETTEDLQQEKRNKLDEAFVVGDCNLMKILSKSSRSDDTYEAVKGNYSSSSKFKLARNMSNSTIDAHTKVRDWIAHKYSPKFFRKPRTMEPIPPLKPNSEKNEAVILENNSTLGRSPTRPVSPSDDQIKQFRPPLVKSQSTNSQNKRKAEKVSVAIDATPAGRGSSVLNQIPIELTKSMDYPCGKTIEVPLRRSFTLEDFSEKTLEAKQDLRKSTTNIHLQFPQPSEEVIQISHKYSRSDPVQDNYSCSAKKLLRTFDPYGDVNVTSRDEATFVKTEMTPEEALQTIKRRNYPKVLPDFPGREALAHKRRSMPVSSHLCTSQPKAFKINPPAPPPRTTSTLGRKPAPNQLPTTCLSEPTLAEEPPKARDSEIIFNNLYVGPLIPKKQPEAKLDTSPIYESLRNNNPDKKPSSTSIPKALVTTDTKQPLKKIEPKIIIKPTISRNISDAKKNIPRVVVSDNISSEVKVTHEDETGGKHTKGKSGIPVKQNSFKGRNLQTPSQIPTLAAKNSKESSSSESTPSEESDTGTVVKRQIK